MMTSILSKRLGRTVTAAVAAGAMLVFAGCDNSSGGKHAAVNIQKTIAKVCAGSEGPERGPRTVTPVDWDGENGLDGFIVVCINGKTAWVSKP